MSKPLGIKGLPVASQALSSGIVWEVDVSAWPTETKPPTKKGVKGKKKMLRPVKPSSGQIRSENLAEDDESSADISDQRVNDEEENVEAAKEHDEDESDFDDEEAMNYIPPKNKATVEQMAHRKFMDTKKWYCISRPQYSKSCGISSLVSCWNYLFSKLGNGIHKPITQEEALTVLDFKPPFGQIGFGSFTGNQTLLRWFKQLNDHYGVRGRGFFLYKPIGRNKTSGVKGSQALKRLKDFLKRDDTAIVYHCLNHYFCPVGYEEVPRKAWDAYNCKVGEKDLTTWVLVGDSSKKHPGIHCMRWDDIEQDLNLQMPNFLDVRRLHLGVQKRNTTKKSGNLHCLMAFQKSAWQGRKTSITKCLKGKVRKPAMRMRSAESAKSAENNVHLPPIEGSTVNHVNDSDDEMSHWVRSGALVDCIRGDSRDMEFVPKPPPMHRNSCGSLGAVNHNASCENCKHLEKLAVNDLGLGYDQTRTSVGEGNGARLVCDGDMKVDGNLTNLSIGSHKGMAMTENLCEKLSSRQDSLVSACVDDAMEVRSQFTEDDIQMNDPNGEYEGT